MTTLEVREPETRQAKPFALNVSAPCVAAIPIEIRESAYEILTDEIRPIVEGYLAVLAKLACAEDLPVSRIVMFKRFDMDFRCDRIHAYFFLGLTPDQTFDFSDRAEEPVEKWVRTLTPEQDRILENNIHVGIVWDGYVF